MSIDAIREALHVVAGVLVWPVLTGLLALAAATLVMAGAFARDVWDRVRGRTAALDSARAALDVVARTDHAAPLDLRLEEVLQAHERRRQRSVRYVRLAVRVGPALGLMGTLIPMADALQGLAEGNLPALASNMVTAFAATVIGLTISVIAYVIASLRDDWARQDVQTLAMHAEHLLSERQPARQRAGAA